MHTLIGRGVIAGLLFSLLSICSGKSWAYNIWYWEDWASTAGCYTHQTYLGCVAQCGPSDDKAERRVIKHPDPAVDPSHDRDWVCQIKSRPLYCPPPYTLDMRELMPNYYSVACRAYCPTGYTWDAAKKKCRAPKVAASCATTSHHPIDFIAGKKYRREPVIAVEAESPLEFIFYYNNQTGLEKFRSSFHTRYTTRSYAAAILDNLFYEPQYLRDYSAIAEEQSDELVKGISDYWRHNYSDALILGNGVITWSSTTGEDVVFINGRSDIYPAMNLTPLMQAEFNYSGYRLQLGRSDLQKVFDIQGRLRRVEYTNGIVHNIIYLPDTNQIMRIEHSRGGSLTFSYLEKDVKSTYTVEPLKQLLLYQITDHTGKTAFIEWNKTFSGAVRDYFLISRISHPAVGAPESGRDFEYNHSMYGGFLTHIYDVKDIVNNTRTLYANFGYDDQGRAVYSGLADGVEAISVDYVDSATRKVTAALGRESTYKFVSLNGILRLQSVTGEPSQNCLKTEAAYEYNSQGGVIKRIQNNQTTTYLYNANGQEISRTEAAGTPQARTITTEWHPNFYVKTRMVEGGKETLYTYDDNGRLLSTTTHPLPIQ